MRKATLSVAVLCLTQWAQAQVSNQVQVYVRPGTEVHVYEDMTNTTTGSFEVGDEGLLYVDGTLTNNGSMTFNNASSLLRGSIGTNNNLGGAVTGDVPPTQAFWVRVPNDGQTGSLSFDNSMRSHGTLAGIYKTEAEEGTIRMTLSNGTLSDESIVLFNAVAEDGYDDFDSQKFWAAASIPQLYTT